MWEVAEAGRTARGRRLGNRASTAATGAGSPAQPGLGRDSGRCCGRVLRVKLANSTSRRDGGNARWRYRVMHRLLGPGSCQPGKDRIPARALLHRDDSGVEVGDRDAAVVIDVEAAVGRVLLGEGTVLRGDHEVRALP